MVTLVFCGKELHKRCISKTQTQENSHTMYKNIGPNPTYFKTYQALPSSHFFGSRNPAFLCSLGAEVQHLAENECIKVDHNQICTRYYVLIGMFTS